MKRRLLAALATGVLLMAMQPGVAAARPARLQLYTDWSFACFSGSLVNPSDPLARSYAAITFDGSTIIADVVVKELSPKTGYDVFIDSGSCSVQAIGTLMTNKAGNGSIQVSTTAGGDWASLVLSGGVIAGRTETVSVPAP
jgi:hypothetical protein